MLFQRRKKKVKIHSYSATGDCDKTASCVNTPIDINVTHSEMKSLSLSYFIESNVTYYLCESQSQPSLYRVNGPLLSVHKVDGYFSLASPFMDCFDSTLQNCCHEQISLIFVTRKKQFSTKSILYSTPAKHIGVILTL